MPPSFNGLPIELQIYIVELALLQGPFETDLFRDCTFKISPKFSVELCLFSRTDNPYDKGLDLHDFCLDISRRRDEFKDLRLINRGFCAALTPFVFSSVHITPNLLSVERACSIAKSDLRHHVRELIYHPESMWRYGDKSFSAFCRYKSSHAYREDYPESLHPKGHDKVLHEQYLREHESTSNFSGWDAGIALTLTTAFTNLLSLSIASTRTDFSSGFVSRYTLKKFGLSYFCEDDTWTDDFLQTVGAKMSIKVVNGTIMDLHDARRILALSTGNGHSSVQSSVCAQESPLEYLVMSDIFVGSRYMIEGLSKAECFKIMNNVRKLIIDFGGRQASEYETLSVPSSHPSSNVTSLTIRNGTLQQSKLAVTLVCFAPKLTKLTIDALSIYDSDHEPIRGLIPTLYLLSQRSKLNEVYIGASCRDIKCGRSPYREDTPFDAVIMQKVVDATCHRRPWPFDLHVGFDNRYEHGTNAYRAQQFCYQPWALTKDIFE